MKRLKKAMAIILAGTMTLALFGCSSKNKKEDKETKNAKTETKSEAEKTNAEDTKQEETTTDPTFDFSKEWALVGYNVYYPDGVRFDPAGYGMIYELRQDDIVYLVTFGCPGESGVFLELQNLDEAPEASMKYLTHNVEYYHDYFGSSMAQQTIGKTEKVTINDIEMLYVEGDLYNKDNQDLKYPYQAYYWLSYGSPVYLLVMAADHPDKGAEYIDKMIHLVQKRT